MDQTQYVGLFDLFVVALIMFGPALYSSFRARAGVVCKDCADADRLADHEACEFSTRENVYALFSQAAQLGAAMLYLHVRGIDPFGFRFHVSLESVAAAIALFCVLGLLMDVATSFKDGFGWIPDVLKHNIPIVSASEGLSPSLVAISVLNGFYEEFFFLAVCTSVSSEYIGIALVCALVIRVMIHTYQGWFTALVMGAGMGLAYFLLFGSVTDNLFVFALAHAIADVFGLSLFNLL